MGAWCDSLSCDLVTLTWVHGVTHCHVIIVSPLYENIYICNKVVVEYLWILSTLIARDTIPYIYHKRVTVIQQ